ncbi:hypothetical protein AAY473_027959 [Plecturocebus cupreus]
MEMLECSGMISAHCNLYLLGSSYSPDLASQRQGFTTLARLVSNSCSQVIHLPRPLKVLGLQVYVPRVQSYGLIHRVRCSVKRRGFTMLARLKLLTSSNPPASAFQSAEIIGVSYHTRPDTSIPQNRSITSEETPNLILVQGVVKSHRLTSGSRFHLKGCNPRVQGKPAQHGKTSSLQKIQKLAGHGDVCLSSQLLGRLRWEDLLRRGGWECSEQ